MNRKQLVNEIFSKKSFLCVGLDTDLKKIPEFLLNEDDPIFAFNKAIIDATAPYCVAYKPNLAFYECFGLKGMAAFERTIPYSLHCCRRKAWRHRKHFKHVCKNILRGIRC